MGTVYEARNLTTRKRCAVKVLFSHLAGDAEILERFSREALAAGMIECEHVVSAFASGTDAEGRAYYAMEYLRGEDLAHVLGRVHRLSPRVAAKIALQVARGLAAAHALDIVHRDIKPANLFLAETFSGELTVKILDFGVAKVKVELAEESLGSLTQANTLLGTIRYMSPWQLKSCKEVDGSADAWSLGVVLYECLTGHLPWGTGGSLGELVPAILTQPIPSVRAKAPWVTPELARVVERALSRHEGSRFANGDALRRALEALVVHPARLVATDLAPPTSDELAVAEPAVCDDTVAVVASVGPKSRASEIFLGKRRELLATAALSGMLVGVYLFMGSNQSSPPQAALQAIRPEAALTAPTRINPPVDVPRSLPLNPEALSLASITPSAGSHSPLTQQSPGSVVEAAGERRASNRRRKASRDNAKPEAGKGNGELGSGNSELTSVSPAAALGTAGSQDQAPKHVGVATPDNLEPSAIVRHGGIADFPERAAPHTP